MSYEDPVLILSRSFLFSLAAVKPATTQSPGAITEHFTLNFTITNLMFTTDLQTPNSRKFRSTEKIMKHYVSQSHVVFHWNPPGFWVSHLHKDFSLPDWPPASEEQHWPPFLWLQSDRIQVSNNLRFTWNCSKWISLHLTDTLIIVLLFPVVAFITIKLLCPFVRSLSYKAFFLVRPYSVISALHLRTVDRFMGRGFLITSEKKKTQIFLITNRSSMIFNSSGLGRTGIAQEWTPSAAMERAPRCPILTQLRFTKSWGQWQVASPSWESTAWTTRASMSMVSVWFSHSSGHWSSLGPPRLSGITSMLKKWPWGGGLEFSA